MATSVLSADSHITEPADTYVDRIDPAYRDDAPRMVFDENLGDVFIVPGFRRPLLMGLVAAAGKSADQIAEAGTRFEDMHRGGWDPEARLADQDRDGGAGGVLYPTPGVTPGHHPERR